MRLKERHKRDLKKAIEELTAMYETNIENDYVFKPMVNQRSGFFNGGLSASYLF